MAALLPYLAIAELVLLLAGLGLLVWLLLALREFRNGTHAALQQVQIQMAYLSGVLRAPKRFLADAPLPPGLPDEPELPTEVIVPNDQWWDQNDAETYGEDVEPGRSHG